MDVVARWVVLQQWTDRVWEMYCNKIHRAVGCRWIGHVAIFGRWEIGVATGECVARQVQLCRQRWRCNGGWDVAMADELLQGAGQCTGEVLQ